MDYFLVQLILAARNSDSENTGWMQTLFFIILAIFYVAGSILKARANKKSEKKEVEEVDQKRPRRESSKPTPEVPKFLLKLLYPQEQPPQKQPHPEVRPPHRKVTRPATARRAFAETSPQPVGRKAYTKTKKPFGPPTLGPLEASKSSTPRPQLQPQLGELPELTSETVMKPKEKPTGITMETPQPKYLAEPLLDYEDPEKLRRAILHYEILGKPLSLRDPSEHIIGL